MLVLVIGSLAWVFPGASASWLGNWLLPVSSIAGLGFALRLAVDWPWLRGFVTVLAVTLIIGWAKAPDSGHATSHFAGASLGLLLMLIMGRMACNPQRLRWALLALLGAGFFVLALALAGSDLSGAVPVASVLISGLPTVRLGLAGMDPSGVINPNALAAAALLIAPFGVSIMFLGRREKIDLFGLQPLGFVVAAAGVLALAVSESRSALMAVWLTLVCLLVRGVRWWGWRLLVGTLVVVAPLLVVATVPSTSRSDFLLNASFLWRTVGDRAQIARAGVDRLKESPWFGIGMNRFRDVYEPPATAAGAHPADYEMYPVADYDVAHAHNVYLQTALDVGVLGLVAYCGVVWFLLLRADQVARGPTGPGRAAAVGGALSLIAISLFGLSDAVALGAKIGLLQWLAAGLILAAWRTQLGSGKATPSDPVMSAEPDGLDAAG